MLNGAVQTWIFHRGFYEVYWHSDVRMASVFVSAAIYLILADRSFHPSVPLISAAIGLSVSLIGSIPDPLKYTVGTFGLALSLTTMRSASPWVRRILSTPILTVFGLGSFSLYLWQQPFAGKEPHLLLLGAVFLCAALSYLVIEKPARAGLNALFPGARRVRAKESEGEAVAPRAGRPSSKGG
jgi:peptidoglycan/LPS O-acetylase OafA/YrhL